MVEAFYDQAKITTLSKKKKIKDDTLNVGCFFYEREREGEPSDSELRLVGHFDLHHELCAKSKNSMTLFWLMLPLPAVLHCPRLWHCAVRIVSPLSVL